MFPDDSSVTFPNPDSTDEATEFIVTFDKTKVWCAVSSLSLNLNKTNYVHFTADVNSKFHKFWRYSN